MRWLPVPLSTQSFDKRPAVAVAMRCDAMRTARMRMRRAAQGEGAFFAEGGAVELK
jgi:hypothetical protein